MPRNMNRPARFLLVAALLAAGCKRSTPSPPAPLDASATPIAAPAPPPAPIGRIAPIAPPAAPKPEPSPAWLEGGTLAELPAGAAAAFLVPLDAAASAHLRRALLDLAGVLGLRGRVDEVLRFTSLGL